MEKLKNTPRLAGKGADVKSQLYSKSLRRICQWVTN
jgi:hypothetical protein